MIVLEIAGWAGALLYLYAYLLIVLKINTTRRHYFLANAIAATGVAAVSLLQGTYQAVTLNLAWLFISGFRFFGVSMPNLTPGPTFFRILAPVWLVWVLVSYRKLGPVYSISALAWLGTVIFLLAYILFVNERILTKEFNLWNIAAPIALLPRLHNDANWPVLALELVWAAAAVYATLTDQPSAHAEQ
jgi:hypothetical protein